MYETISIVLWEHAGVDICISKIYGVLSSDSESIRRNVKPCELRTYRIGGYVMLTATMEENWEAWTRKMLELSRDGSVQNDKKELSDEGRRLARICYEHMR